MTPGTSQPGTPGHNHAWKTSIAESCKPGCPYYDAVNDILDVVQTDRVPPRECIRAARDALNRAYGISDSRQTWPFMLEALDWLRRGLEQVAAQLPDVAGRGTPDGDTP